MISLSFATVCDITVVIISMYLLWRFGGLRHSHPGVIYIFFHIYAISFRALTVLSGAPTLFSAWGGTYDPVREEEISRAVLMADVALGSMVLAWLLVPLIHKRALRKGPAPSSRRLTSLYIWAVAAIVFPVGCAGLFGLAYLPGVSFDDSLSLGEWQQSSWIAITQTWPGLCLLALIFWYGFRWWLTAPMALYLLVMSYQGYHRFRVVIPIIMLIQIYLDRHGRKWPTLTATIVLACVGLLFFPLKNIGTMAQAGYSASEIIANSKAIVETALSGEHDDQSFLDQMASAVTLVDERGKFYWGQPYAALITLPIPRQWWPEKPGLADYMDDFSVRSRPMKEMGMIATVIGESYANFGYPGIVAIPFALAWLLGWIYTSAYSNPYFSVARFGYLMLACNLIQVFRDGVVSMITFTAVNMMPLLVIILLHWMLRRPRQPENWSPLAPRLIPTEAGVERLG